MKEVVADTNVLVSALLATPSSPPRIFLMKVITGEVGLVLSPRLLLEIVSVVITGDKDLIALHPFRGTLPILTPAEFLSSLKTR